jgi:hypothetical protein
LIVIYPNELSPFYWNRSFCPTPWPNTTSARFLKGKILSYVSYFIKDFRVDKISLLKYALGTA